MRRATSRYTPLPEPLSTPVRSLTLCSPRAAKIAVLTTSGRGAAALQIWTARTLPASRAAPAAQAAVLTGNLAGAAHGRHRSGACRFNLPDGEKLDQPSTRLASARF